MFEKTSFTVPSLKNGSIPASWAFICKNIRELATYKDFNLAYLWSKYERESGVKFDIQRDSTSKISQQAKDNALTNCDTEHVTDNLVTTVSQKSKSYLEAEKVNIADNNNNQIYSTRPTLEQGVAGNEGVPTSESPTTLEVVPNVESPNPLKSRDKQAILRKKGLMTAESPTTLEVVPREHPVTNGKSTETREYRPLNHLPHWRL